MAWIHMMSIHMTWIHMISWIHIYNNIGAFYSDRNHHVKLLATILHWLRKYGFTVNPLKEKLTGLDIGLHHKVYTLEKDDQCHTPHGST